MDKADMKQLDKNLHGDHKKISGLVSVVIPTYNQKDFVHETIDSVLVQDYKNIEIIITDDGSKDGTIRIIQEYAAKYPDKIFPVLSERNTGIAANLNRGLAKVRGEYIAWLAGDDLMFSGKVRKQVDLLDTRSDAVGCCHDAEVFNSSDGKIFGLFSMLMNKKFGFREGGVELWFDTSYFMLPSTVMIRSEAVSVYGFDERLKYLNDWLFDVEVFRQGKCIPLNEVLGRYRRHDNNVTGSVDARKIGIEEGIIALSILDSRYPELYRFTRKARITNLLVAVAQAFNSGDLKKSKDYLKIAIRQGAVIRGPILFVGLRLLGPFIIRQMAVKPYERSPLFLKLSKLIKG
jgi:glycosyltransferase involved in cell wall biosynthesis